jgi:carbamoyltransferase
MPALARGGLCPAPLRARLFGLTAILGLNAYHGDAAAALVVGGQLVCAAEEERFSRVKHCAGFPAQAAAWCLSYAGLSAAELDHVAIGRNPKANLGAKLMRTLTHGASPRYLKARLENAARVRDVKAELETALDAEVQAELHHVEHHQAHVASAFFPSPYEDAAILSLDGFGDFASTMLAEGRGASLRVLERVLFPHSLGIFYTAVTQWLGFPKYGDEGKVMGLAPYGTSRFVDEMRRIVRPKGGVFELDLEYFRHHREGVDMTWDEGTPTIGTLFSERMEEAFGPAREPTAELTALHEDVAASLQVVLEETYLHLVRALWERTKIPRICLAGGVALNAVANGRIRPETPFEDVFVQPAAGDSGIAVGSALYVWHQELGRPRGFAMEHAYWGPDYSEAECAAALAADGLHATHLDDAALFEHVARRIAEGDVVGWFQGRMEYGPRALGHRSIVADPRRPDMKDVLNARIKHRELFRPFAPSIVAGSTGEWFEQDYPSPYMVLVYKTRIEKRELIPAVNHVDDTGRLQTVTEEASPRFYRLIEAFERETGVPILLNTSFNENEPVVMTPEHAIETFRKTRMDLLVLGNSVVRRSDGGAEERSEAAALGGQVEAQR